MFWSIIFSKSIFFFLKLSPTTGKETPKFFYQQLSFLSSLCSNLGWFSFTLTCHLEFSSPVAERMATNILLMHSKSLKKYLGRHWDSWSAHLGLDPNSSTVTCTCAQSQLAVSLCCSFPVCLLVSNQIPLVSVPRALRQPVPSLFPVSAHLTPAWVRAPGPLLSWQENKDSWQWEKSVKENMSTVVVMALLSENSLCQGQAWASHTCYMDRCFQLLPLTSLQARLLSDWLSLDSEGNKGNWG